MNGFYLVIINEHHFEAFVLKYLMRIGFNIIFNLTVQIWCCYLPLSIGNVACEKEQVFGRGGEGGREREREREREMINCIVCRPGFVV